MADSGTYSPDTIARRQKIADALLMQAVKPREIRSPLQGVGQLGEAALAGWEGYRADQDEKTAQKEALAAALTAFGGGGTPSGQVPTAPQSAPAPNMGNVPVPEQYRPILERAAAEHGLNPETYARQINQESGFKPGLTSPAGAAGLAQFMPRTAKQYGVNVNDAESSLTGGARYMADLKRQFNGDEGHALAAYNWGPGNLQKWLAAGGDLNRVPAETQNYVKSITGQPLSAAQKVAGALNGGGGSPQATPAAASAPAGTAAPAGGSAAAIAAIMNPRTPPAIAAALAAQMNPQMQIVPLQDGRIIGINPRTGEKKVISEEGSKPTWGVIREDAEGNKIHGWIDPYKKTVEVPGEVPGAAAKAPEPVTGPDGKPIPIPAGVNPKEFRKQVTHGVADAAIGKKTEVQAKDEKFANKMELAEKQMVGGGDAEGLSLKSRALEGSPYIPGTSTVGNFYQTEKYQKYKQARDNFITALLRDESGAAIGTPEFVRYEKELFPQPGDKPGVVTQKAEARRIAIEGMKKGAGPGYKPPTEAAAATAPVKVKTPEEAMKLASGTKIEMPDGSLGTVP